MNLAEMFKDMVSKPIDTMSSNTYYKIVKCRVVYMSAMAPEHLSHIYGTQPRNGFCYKDRYVADGMLRQCLNIIKGDYQLFTIEFDEVFEQKYEVGRVINDLYKSDVGKCQGILRGESDELLKMLRSPTINMIQCLTFSEENTMC
jgi:hypothetical protein